ncbi:MAG: glycosyltransferase family 4 protein [Janthinobacterium lividum]
MTAVDVRGLTAHLGIAGRVRSAVAGGRTASAHAGAGAAEPTDTSARRRGSRILIIVQNLPVPFDRRVWLECGALTEAGYDVTVVCPKGKGDETETVVDGVRLLKYAPYAPGGSAAGFVTEYVYSFLRTLALVNRARRAGAFAVVQACNPPDIFWPIARWLRAVDGTRFVFDHHDLCPELYDSRFTAGDSVPRRGLLALERATFRTADHVVSTNDSYAAIAVRRGGKPTSDVTVVRTGPDEKRLQRRDAVPALLRGRAHLVTYIGVMGPQDGVDLAVRAAAYVVHDLGRTDVSFTFMGAGDCWSELVALRDELGLTDVVDLPGRVPDEFVFDVMSTSVVGLSPDPCNPLNDLSTMNKTLEYMSFGLPVVAFDLKETRVSAGDSAVYVRDGDIGAYATAIVDLLDDAPRRERMGGEGRLRIEHGLSWSFQSEAYVGVMDALVARTTLQKISVT